MLKPKSMEIEISHHQEALPFAIHAMKPRCLGIDIDIDIFDIGVLVYDISISVKAINTYDYKHNGHYNCLLASP